MEPYLLVRLPDNSPAYQGPCVQRTVLGRSPALNHPCISRAQLALAPASHGRLYLEALGPNPLEVQIPSEGGPIKKQLPTGSTLQLRAGYRFYVVSLEQESACTVELFTPTSYQEQAASDGKPASTPLISYPSQQTLPLAGASTQPAAAPEVMAQPAPAIDLTLSDADDEVQVVYTSPRTARPPTTHSLHKRQQQPEVEVVSAEEAKRRRVAASPIQQQQAGTSGAGGSRSAAPSDEHAWLHQDTPFKLFRVQGLSQGVNQGCLGASLSDLVVGDMQLVVMMNFLVDLTWLVSACPDLKAADKLVLCYGSGEDRLPEEAFTLGLHDKMVMHKPHLPLPYGTVHTKSFIIKYQQGVRVIIHTANLVPGDCNNKTQAMWCQDFPLKDHLSPRSSACEEDLCSYITSLKLPTQVHQEVCGALRAVDMSSSRAAVVSSVPGYHARDALHKHGHMRIRHLLKQEALPGGDEWVSRSHLVCQSSSLGSLDDNWLTREFAVSLSAAAASAAPAGSQLRSPSTSTGRVAPQGLFGASKCVDASRIHFIWPTVQEVRNSLEGWRAGFAIPGTARNVHKPFLAQHMCRYGGEPVGRMMAMPHIKTYCRFLGQQLAWVFVGSHNLSKAAWGQLGKDGKQLTVRSYELGTLFTPRLEAAYQAHRHRGFRLNTGGGQPRPRAQPWTLPGANAAQPGSVQFWTLDSMRGQQPSRGVEGDSGSGQRVMMPLPYKLPPSAYGRLDEPWTCDELHDGQDILGFSIALAPGGRIGLMQEGYEEG